MIMNPSGAVPVSTHVSTIKVAPPLSHGYPVQTVRTGPLIGLFAQLALLSMLYATVGLDALGWVTGIAYGVVVCATLTAGLNRSGADELTPADRVTLTRATLVGAVTALTVSSVSSVDGHAPVAAMTALTTVALALDFVDGKVARLTGKITALGARFDMEVDAFLILVLSFLVMPSVGGWVLAIGLMRYAFVAASWVLPWMRGTLPPRPWRKVVAATQGIVLAVAAAGVLPHLAAIAAVAASLALLAESFGRDVLWLRRRRSVPLVVVTASAGRAVDVAVARR
jgi:phosphatidylglycerophosphate synthase